MVSCYSMAQTVTHKPKKIYKDWLKRHEGSDKITGSKTADTRAALVEHFKEHGTIMIATEAGAEGINLQFCSLIINYDLPWNPQRVEQRIGRCHRYGQKHDVVVVNFVDESNEADARVYELLEKKISAFRRRIRRQRRSVGGDRFGRGYRTAHCRNLPKLPTARRHQKRI